MDASILAGIRQSFITVPEKDERAKVGPRAFLIALVVAIVTDGNGRSIANLRRQLNSSLGVLLARSSFWQRLSSKRMTSFLCHAIRDLVQNLGGKLRINQDILEKLGVRAVYLHDSSSVTLLDGAKGDFPAPRNNVAPAALKWHLCLNLFSGIGEWFSVTEATCHDRNVFPPLKMLKGALSLFDLGYWDYQLLSDLSANGVYFLSRVKDRALVEITGVVASTAWKKPLGRDLFSLSWKTFRGNVIEYLGTVKLKDDTLVDMRVIGFWNEGAKVYHWYVTNLSVPAELIYPLYRLRWQIELVFKSGKSSLSMADVPSSNSRIIINLVLAAITANLIAQPLARMTLQNATKPVQAAISVQRAGFVFVHVARELLTFLVSGLLVAKRALKEKLQSFASEFVDPNYKHRATSLQRLAVL